MTPLMQSFFQVYGGTASVFIGSYSWSRILSATWYGQSSTAQSGHTSCIGCTISVFDVAIINSIAVSNTTGKCGTSFTLFLRRVHDFFVYYYGCATTNLYAQAHLTDRLYEQRPAFDFVFVIHDGGAGLWWIDVICRWGVPVQRR